MGVSNIQKAKLTSLRALDTIESIKEEMIMTISDKIIRYFVSHEIKLSEMTESFETLTFTDEDGTKIKAKVTDKDLLLQIEAFLSVMPNIVVENSFKELKKFRMTHKNELAPSDFNWDIINDDNGMIMLSRGRIKAAFNTGEDTLGVASGTIFVSHLFNKTQLKPKGFLIYKI